MILFISSQRSSLMKIRKVRFVIIAALVAAMIASSMMVSFAATGSKTVYSTTYNEVIKGSKYAYCSTGKGIYRVNPKTNKIKKISSEGMPDIEPMAMKLYKGYIYYLVGDGINNCLYRVKTNGKNKKFLGNVADYAIKNKTIYYTHYTYNEDTGREVPQHKKMSLTGKNKKKTVYKVYMKNKATNKKGYRVKTVENSNKLTYYLVKPNKKRVKLCRFTFD